jgi:hypothetical protein
MLKLQLKNYKIMNDFHSLRINLITKSFYEKYSKALNINSDIESIKMEFSKEVKNNFEINSENYQIDKVKLEERIEECLVCYQNLLTEEFLAL